jgi:predicted GNAT superfamily acetyltransferase
MFRSYHVSVRHSAAAARFAPDVRPSVVASDVTLRPLGLTGEFRACVALQESTWGQDGETVPVSLLVSATHVGGLVLGAFDAGHTLLGFVFGLSGVDAHGALHWSHMLAVRADVRGAGIGRALKERQRAELARRGVDRISWTFDPLQSRNAHLNINRLGARVVEYVDDMYGVTRSPLHLGMATDRLIVMTGPGAVPAPAAPVIHADGLPILTLLEQEGAPVEDPAPAALLVEVPWEIQEIVSADPALAVRWRNATRRHFHFVMEHGYAVSGFVRDGAARRAYYHFTRR